MEIYAANEVLTWYEDLDDDAQEAVDGRVELLENAGPALKRPTVGEVQGSSIHNLKELRVPAGRGRAIRILFAFDPWGDVILLVAGDKAEGSQWRDWYHGTRGAIAIAEARWTRYLTDREEERRQGF